MKFSIESTFSGVKVRGDAGEFTFKSKPFSHSSVLLDENKDNVVSLRRSSWWRMNFDLVADNKHYQLKQRFTSSTLILNNSDLKFHTMSGHDFFMDNAPATRIAPEGLTVKKYSIEILEIEHWLALLAATCLELQTSMVTKAG